MPSQSTELILAILQGHCRSTAQAETILAAAQRLGVDAVDYCIARYGISPEETLARAARWARLAFSAFVPITEKEPAEAFRVDGFASARSVRTLLFDRPMLYVAPRFDHLLQLRERVLADPGLRRNTCVAPASAIRTALARLNEQQLLDQSRQRLSRRWPHASAGLDLGRRARLILLGLATVLALLALLAPLAIEIVLLPLFGVLLLGPAIFRFAAIGNQPRSEALPPPLDDGDLPVYSVLIPLRDEAQMVPMLQQAMTALSYPPEKLDIKFVVEAASEATVAAVKPLLADPRFELVIVPDALPHTKPKALDYALPFARGRYLVVYDAEDIPNPDQLRLAAAAFAADPGIDCLQAELLIDNARENALTGLFTGEYAAQFGIVMPALVRWSLPVPLGGTSNHFRLEALREVGGWDAFNVTEDADLGVRLARLRYRTGMLASQTYEEAPVSIPVWMRQRTRWMKGWMQVFIVHNRHPVTLLRDMGWRNLLAFEIHLGSLILSPLLHTGFLLALLHQALTGSGTIAGPTGPLSLAEFTILVVGYGSSLAVVFAGLARLGQRRLLPHQFLLPLYWILHSLATIRAGYELMTRPHFWAKTTHGLTRLDRSRATEAGSGDGAAVARENDRHA